MNNYSPSTLRILTEFFTSDTIEQTARRTGFVRRQSKITGKVFLALVTFGLWSNGLCRGGVRVIQTGSKRGMISSCCRRHYRFG